MSLVRKPLPDRRGRIVQTEVGFSPNAGCRRNVRDTRHQANRPGEEMFPRFEHGQERPPGEAGAGFGATATLELLVSWPAWIRSRQPRSSWC